MSLPLPPLAIVFFLNFNFCPAGSASGGISSHDGCKNGTDSDCNTEPSIISTISSSFNRKKL